MSENPEMGIQLVHFSSRRPGRPRIQICCPSGPAGGGSGADYISVRNKVRCAA